MESTWNMPVENTVRPISNALKPRTRPRSEERRVGKECRSRCDWSSDVCSSDLAPGAQDIERDGEHLEHAGREHREADLQRAEAAHPAEIGRASCRERV